MLGGREVGGTRHRHLVCIEAKAFPIQGIELAWHVLLVVLNDLESEISFVKVIEPLQHLILLDVICQGYAAFGNVQELFVFIFILFLHGFSDGSHESIGFGIVLDGLCDVVVFDGTQEVSGVFISLSCHEHLNEVFREEHDLLSVAPKLVSYREAHIRISTLLERIQALLKVLWLVGAHIEEPSFLHIASLLEVVSKCSLHLSVQFLIMFI